MSPDELREVSGIRLLTTADEVEVLADARLKLLAAVLADETTDVVGFALVKHRHDVHAETASGEGDSDAVRVSHDLVGRKRRVLGGDEATDLITSADLRLFSYSHQRECCICRNFAQF